MKKNRLIHLINTLAQGNHEQLVTSLSEVCQEAVGYKLLTVMKVDFHEHRCCRIFTTDHESYPNGGYKPIPENQWTNQVIVNKECFIGSNIDEISEVFFDYKLIESLGLGSVINIPVIHFGEILGTINLLHESGFYNQDSISQLQELLPWFVIALRGLFIEGKCIGDINDSAQ